jgi:hypothetical protein
MEPRPAADSRAQLIRWMGIEDANTAYLTMVAVDGEGARCPCRR